MGNTKSVPVNSFGTSNKAAALIAPEELSGRRQRRGSNESSKHDRAPAAGPPKRSPTKLIPVVEVGLPAPPVGLPIKAASERVRATRGSDLHHGRRGCGLELVSIEDRVGLVKGELYVNSKPGERTRVEVRIPVGRV